MKYNPYEYCKQCCLKFQCIYKQSCLCQNKKGN